MPAPILPKSGSPNVWRSTGTSGSTLNGSGGRDQLAANNTKITLIGGGGDDTYVAYDSLTKVVEQAGGGIDTVMTWGHSYTLSANVENLTLKGTANSKAVGNSGNNIITGNDGNNTIVTGGGNDVLVGSKGADTYVPTKQANSTTWITNFKTSGSVVDKIDLRGFGLNGFSSIQSRMTQVGSDLRIDLGNGQKVMLENKSKSSFTAANFLVESGASSGSTGTGSTGTGSSTGSGNTNTGSTGGAGSGSTGSTGGPHTPATGLPFSDLKLTFADEFDTLNLYSTWMPYDAWGNRNLVASGGQQIYVDPKFKGLGLNPFSVKDGILTITAAKADPALKSKLGFPYTSGELTSYGSFAQQYGYFEMRAQLPTEQGMWPAFWMLSTNLKWPPEIDIVEVVGLKPTAVVQSVHSNISGHTTGKTTWASEDVGKGFHTYGVDWTKDTITFYFDGKKTYSTPTPADFHTPMYLLLNLGVGGTWPGSPDSTTDWSKTKLKVDYIRAYQHTGSATAAAKSASTSGATSGFTAGNDRIVTDTTSPTTVAGGAGKDVFEFIRGAHATISDFNPAEDSIVIRGGSASSVQIKAGAGSTVIDLGGASITLAGVTAPSSSINIAYA